jgi:CheY-like chemotaxis protein
MEYNYEIILDANGVVKKVNDDALAIMGLPRASVLDQRLDDHLSTITGNRFLEEVDAINEGLQRSTRLKVEFIGLDDQLRPVVLRLSGEKQTGVAATLHPTPSETSTTTSGAFSSIGNPRHLLPVSRRVTTICRRATDKQTLLSEAMAVISEVTPTRAAAAIEWGGTAANWSVAAIDSNFDQEYLNGVFRSSVISRLSRGDVIIKDASLDGTISDQSLILLPLMASDSPEGIIILYVGGFSTISAEEQQSLGLLGEIIGLGIKGLTAPTETSDESQIRASDNEATVALGRLSAGLAHEINNAVTILHNNIQQITTAPRRLANANVLETITKDSKVAVNAINDLTDALKAFAPEETQEQQEVNLVRLIETVRSAVKFYGKRGIEISISIPSSRPIYIRCRSHYLVRALFLISIEMVDAALASGKVLMVDISLTPTSSTVSLIISISAGTFSIPSVLLSQLEKNGVFARLLEKAGAELAYTVDEDLLSLNIDLPLLSTAEVRKSVMPAFVSKDKPARRGMILIVDDEPAVLRSTRRVLEQDHDILAASSGKEALKIVKENPRIDVALLDIFMNEMDGIQVAEHLKQNNPAFENSIIFMTGGATDAETAEYLDRNQHPVLEKPVDIDTLKSHILKCL